MRVELQSGYVIHTRPFRDSSLLVDFFCPQYGSVRAVAKGVRGTNKTAKQKRSLIQPFMPLLITWGGRGELKTLYHIEAQPQRYKLQAERLFSALYVNELLSRLLRSEEEQPEIFDLYEQVLAQLSSHQPIDIVLRCFELRLLDLLGYGLNLTHIADTGEPVCAETYYQFYPEVGLRLASQPVPSANSFYGADLLAIASGDYQVSARATAKRLCRQALGYYLGSKPLKSRELFIATKTESG